MHRFEYGERHIDVRTAQAAQDAKEYIRSATILQALQVTNQMPAAATYSRYLITLYALCCSICASRSVGCNGLRDGIDLLQVPHPRPRHLIAPRHIQGP